MARVVCSRGNQHRNLKLSVDRGIKTAGVRMSVSPRLKLGMRGLLCSCSPVILAACKGG